MKYIKFLMSFIVIAMLMCAITSCAGDGQRVNTTESFDNYDVEKIFVVDSITVYRFYDNGHYHYFTNRPGIVNSTYTNDKTTVHEEINCN